MDNTINQKEIDEARKELEVLQIQIKQEEETLALLREEIERKQEYVIKIQADAENKAKEIIASAREEAEMIRKSTIIGISTDDYSDQQNDTYERAGNAITKEEVEDRVRTLENEIRELLNGYRDSIQAMLYSFRTGLYSIEYTQICDAYQRLYLFVTSNLEKRIVKIQENDTIDPESKKNIEIEIKEIQGLLLKRVGRVERGLECMGLTLIKPAVGEEYNCNEHVADNAEDDGDMVANIIWCSCPGVKSETTVLCKANVGVVEN